MGCSCVANTKEPDLDTESFNYLTLKFKSNPKLLNSLIVIQSKIRGIIIRSKMKSLQTKKFFPTDSSYKYIQITSNKITNKDIKKLFNRYPALEDGIPVKLKPIVEYENKAIFYGEWSEITNQRYGRGIQIWLNNTRYEGYWKNDKANIRGKLTYANGDIYEGEWVDDKAEGYGVYTHRDGIIYEGYWKNNKQDGRGIEKCPDGTLYEGDYKNGKKCGNGIFKGKNGSVYEGEFVDNCFYGKGIYTWSDKRQYTGMWKNNKMNGEGLFTWADGRKYQGNYQNDKKEGFGEFVWSDGRIYRGFWKNGKQHGKGEFYQPKTKKWKKGIWEDGKRTIWINSKDINDEGYDENKSYNISNSNFCNIEENKN